MLKIVEKSCLENVLDCPVKVFVDKLTIHLSWMFINCPAIELTSSIVDDIVVVYEELHKEEPFIYIAYLIKLRQKKH